MSRKWSSGFESDSITANVEWDVFTGAGATVQGTTVRSGGFAFKAAPAATTALTRKQFQADTITDTFIRVYFRIHTAPATTIPILQYTDSANGVGTSVRLTSGRLLQLFDDNGTGLQVGSSSSALTLDTWYRVELRTQDGATGATWTKELKIDGVQIAITTTGQSIQGAGKICIGAIASATCELYFDDVAVNINDAEGKGQDGYPGAGSIVHMQPDSAGDNNAWATGAGGTAGAANNFTRVQEVTPDDVTSYNKRIATGALIDDFNLETSASAGIGASDTITLVQVGGRPGSTSATATGRDMKYRIKSQASGTVVSSGVVAINQNAFMSHVNGPPYIYQLTSFVDPQAGGAWTTALLDTAQIGYTTNTSSANEIRMSTLWLLVESVPSAGAPVTKTQSATARIANNLTKVQTAIARIAVNLTKTQTAIARIANLKTKTQTAIARIANNFTKTQGATARIANNPTKTQAAVARIQRLLTKAQTAVARIANNLSKTQSATARIANNLTKTQSATAHITNNPSKTQSAIARIANLVSKTQSAVARIANLKTKTQTAIARIANNSTKTQSAVARIQRLLTKTQTAIARIANLKTKTQSAIARVANTLTKTQSAVARIANLKTKTQSATARIQQLVSKIQSATARIAKNLTKTQSAIARIAKSFTFTQSAVARISALRTKTQSATASLIGNRFKTQSATARLVLRRSKTQSATARIISPPLARRLTIGDNLPLLSPQFTKLNILAAQFTPMAQVADPLTAMNTQPAQFTKVNIAPVQLTPMVQKPVQSVTMTL